MMKNSNVIRLLSVITFLIFFCPFFQMCSDKDLPIRVREPAETTVEVSDGSFIPDVETTAATYPVIKRTEAQKQLELEETRKEYTKNGYQMGFCIFNNELPDTEDLIDPALYAYLCFTLILIFPLFIAASVFRSKPKTTLYLATINLLLAFIPLIIFYLTGILEDVYQIKFGYYLFIFDTIAIIVLAKKSMTPQNRLNALS